MRVIIAGGTGYIGRRLAADWAGAGHEVIVLSRGALPLPPQLPQLSQLSQLPQSPREPGSGRDPGELAGTGGVSFRRWDGRSVEGWGGLVEGAGLVINLAGERVAGPGLRYRWTERRKRLLESSRREAGEALVAAIGTARHRPALFVQASGIDYYGAGEGEADETSRPGSSYLSRLVSEVWEPSTAAVEGMGVRRVVLRLGPVIGPDSPVLAPLVFQHRCFAGGPLGSGRQWFPWVSLDDVAGAIRFAWESHDLSGACNLVAPGILRNMEVSLALGRLLGRPSWLRTPAFALRIAFGEMASTLLDGVRARPTRLIEAGYRFIHPDLGSALQSTLAAGER